MVEQDQFEFEFLSWVADKSMLSYTLRILSFLLEEGSKMKYWAVLQISFSWYHGIYLHVLGYTVSENWKPNWWENIFPPRP